MERKKRMNHTVHGRCRSASTSGPVVSIQRHVANWDDLEGNTWKRVVEIGRRQLAGCYYLNPGFSVSCPVPTKAFFRKARRCQAAWCRTMGQVLGSANRRKVARRSTCLERQLVFTGILIIDGYQVDPRAWTQFEHPIPLADRADS